MTTVGVRELRQRASELLEQVSSSGESIDITNHGRLVARLVPADERRPTSSHADLVRTGAITVGRGRFLEVEPVDLAQGSPTSDELLTQLRDEG